MRTELILTREPIDEAMLVACRARSSELGAVLTFAGVVRNAEAGRRIEAIEYEAFEKMARHQFQILFQSLGERWPAVASVRLIHRLGRVGAGEASLWVEVTAPHRGEAFSACAWLIDEMKRVVPIWKKPLSEDVGLKTGQGRANSGAANDL